MDKGREEWRRGDVVHFPASEERGSLWGPHSDHRWDVTRVMVPEPRAGKEGRRFTIYEGISNGPKDVMETDL
ncbi:hypothetical protein E2C01_073908 [Portunus trituberculatus]|uniref:Uncharacterized protein n=1 Tax=Portunus trituberculatus TaxID=210409 RepID=A0A5B7I6L2_PORTR|nr:hypothetical protein [Portunus trituberculatus]